MSLDGLLTLAGIALAVYAIPGPPQRRSLDVFVPKWLVSIPFLLSAALLLFVEWARIHCPELEREIAFRVVFLAFVLPVLSIVFAASRYYRAELTARQANRFHRFVQACLREDTFDELVRVLEKNISRVGKVLRPETLRLLFEPRFVNAMTNAQTWIHLRLLADDVGLESLGETSRPVDTMIRGYLAGPGSILHASVAYSDGAEEHFSCSEEDWNLVERTLLNPKWFTSRRVDYPLLIVACEHLDSGRFDDHYNRNDRLYIANQGISSRTSCPVFVSMKTHVRMLEAAIETQADDNLDYFVLDLHQLFEAICSHSRYDRGVWESSFENHEYPTPFAYLLKQMLADFKMLCGDYLRPGPSPPVGLGRDLARNWGWCVFHLIRSEGKVCSKMQLDALYTYIDHTLEVRDLHESDDSPTPLWSNVFIENLKENLLDPGNPHDMLQQVVDKLDLGKDHVQRNEVWLRKELELPARPKPTN